MKVYEVKFRVYSKNDTYPVNLNTFRGQPLFNITPDMKVKKVVVREVKGSRKR